MQQKPNPSIIAVRTAKQEDEDVSWFRYNLNKLPDIVIYSWGIPLVILVIVTLTQAQSALAWIEAGCVIAALVSISAIIYGVRVCKKIEQIEQVERTFHEHLQMARPKKA